MLIKPSSTSWWQASNNFFEGNRQNEVSENFGCSGHPRQNTEEIPEYFERKKRFMGFRTFLNFSKNPSGFSKHERHFRKKKFRLFIFFVLRRRRCRCRCCRIRKCHRYKCFLTKKHFASNLLEAFGVNCIHRFKS